MVRSKWRSATCHSGNGHLTFACPLTPEGIVSHFFNRVYRTKKPWSGFDDGCFGSIRIRGPGLEKF